MRQETERKADGRSRAAVPAVLVCAIVLLLFSACGMKGSDGDEGNGSMTVGKIAADQMSQRDIEQNKCYVYVKEGENYVPFIVLTGDYNGKALLLRRDVLPEERRMNDGSSYYAGSDIDNWLNGQYLSMLENADGSPQILDTEILITADEAIGYAGNETESIVRKVFLLSNAELGFDTSANAGTEGTPLGYFKDGDNRIVSDGQEICPWLLRSPCTSELTCSYAIGRDGALYIINTNDFTGIRPAFCVDPLSEIVIREDIIEGEVAYVFKP